MLIGMDLFVGLIQDLRASRDTPAATLPPPTGRTSSGA
jgi:hypothetical protein